MGIKETTEHLERVLSEGLGLDLTDPNLLDTPKRIAKMFHNEFFANVGVDFTDFTTFPNEEHYDQIILLDKIHFVSMCSHHFLPFTGYAWLAYIPNKKLVGASKPSRLIVHYSKRPQLQEKLTKQCLTTFVDEVDPKGAMLVLRGIHQCMTSRGAKQTNGSGMITSAVCGYFKDNPSTKQEALSLIQLSTQL